MAYYECGGNTEFDASKYILQLVYNLGIYESTYTCKEEANYIVFTMTQYQPETRPGYVKLNNGNNIACQIWSGTNVLMGEWRVSSACMAILHVKAGDIIAVQPSYFATSILKIIKY